MTPSGHAGGDAVLKAVAQRFALAIRQQTTPWRAWAATNSPWVATELIFGDDVFARGGKAAPYPDRADRSRWP